MHFTFLFAKNVAISNSSASTMFACSKLVFAPLHCSVARFSVSSIDLGRVHSFRRKPKWWEEGYKLYKERLDRAKKPLVKVEKMANQISRLSFEQKIDEKVPRINRSMEEIQNWMKNHNATLGGKKVPQPVFKFEESLFPEKIQEFLTSRYSEPTPIQSIAWPAAMSRRDFISISAPEADPGKTLGFLLPGIARILKNPEEENIFIVVSTRELAVEVCKIANELCTQLDLKIALCRTGANKNAQIRSIKAGAQVIIGTPRRLVDLIKSRDLKLNLKKTSYLVLDDTDHMIQLGYEKDIRRIYYYLNLWSSTKIQQRHTSMFSDTWSMKVRKLAARFLRKNSVFLNVGPSMISVRPDINQIVEVLEASEREQRIVKLINEIYSVPNSKILIFTETKQTADKLTDSLRFAGMGSTLCINGDKSKKDRKYIMNEFRIAACRILIATDVVARAIDVDNITHVINYDMPKNMANYVHKIGRVERQGKAITFVTSSDKSLAKKLIKQLEETNQEIPQDLKDLASKQVEIFPSDGQTEILPIDSKRKEILPRVVKKENIRKHIR